MADEKEKQTFLQKLLFYTTAFFILLSTFSLFAFLFLVPFVIDPAFTTIFMQFDTRPAECVTIDVESRRGEQSAPSNLPLSLSLSSSLCLSLLCLVLHALYCQWSSSLLVLRCSRLFPRVLNQKWLRLRIFHTHLYV